MSNAAWNYYTGKSVAVKPAETVNAIREAYSGELVVCKCIPFNVSNAISNGNASQLIITKCTLPDISNAIWDDNIGELILPKCPPITALNMGDTAGNNYADQISPRKCLSADMRNR